jgi:hypothetical protein
MYEIFEKKIENLRGGFPIQWNLCPFLSIMVEET